jgi:RNA polymerase sigma factor (sigma-70 family)
MSAVAGRAPVHVGGLSDEELVGLARAGHEAAFDAIVHRYRAPLLSYCRRWLDAHRAEEVVQHTLMKAYLCVRDDDRPLALRPWLYRVAHNAALNAVEKKGSDWEELDENYDGVPQPPQVAEQRARFLRVVGEIGALPSRQREALVLNEFEGRCYADIADQLGTSESGVRGLLRRARRQLRETAAALLLPFPVLRELVRSEGGRGLQAERAGELIGSAGAAGGVGAAGGLAKVAAGVLAAGTIAGGGTAIEHQRGAFRAQEARADVAALQDADTSDSGGGAGAAVSKADRRRAPSAASHLASDGAQLLAAAGLTPGRSGNGFGELDWDSPKTDDPEGVGDSPLLPLDPLAPADAESQEEPAGEEESGAGTDGAESDDAASESKDSESAGSPGADEPVPDEDADASGPGSGPWTPRLPRL